MPVDMVKERSTKLEARKKELAGFLDGTEEPPPLLHPNLAKYYHEEIAALHVQLGNEETRALAADKLRTLVSRIDLVPDGAELVIVLRGDLAAILTFASGKKKPEFLNERAIWKISWAAQAQSDSQKRKKPHEGALLGSQGSLVAGAGFEPAAFRL
jgi:site-specific DNA recombinase